MRMKCIFFPCQNDLGKGVLVWEPLPPPAESSPQDQQEFSLVSPANYPWLITKRWGVAGLLLQPELSHGMGGAGSGILPLVWCRNSLYGSAPSAERSNIIMRPQKGPEFFRTEKENGLCFPSRVPFQVFLWPIRTSLGKAGKDLAASTTRIQGNLDPLVPSLPFPEVPQGNNLALQETAAPAFCFWLLQLQQVPQEKHQRVLLKIKNPRGEDEHFVFQIYQELLELVERVQEMLSGNSRT